MLPVFRAVVKFCTTNRLCSIFIKLLISKNFEKFTMDECKAFSGLLIAETDTVLVLLEFA